MSICLDMIHLPYKLIHTFSSYLSCSTDAVNHKFSSYYNYLSVFNFKSNLKNIKDIIMSSKKKKIHAPKPIDAIREIIEDQQLQINDLSEIVKKQNDEIRGLKAKWSARESLEKEEKERKERQAEQADNSWFWAARTSE